jgi:hypothetical protein
LLSHGPWHFLVFAVYQDSRTPNPDFLYDDFSKSFVRTLDRSGKGNREDGNQRRREITFQFDLGYADFSEWFIGHSGSTYWTKKDSEKAGQRNILQNITLLDISKCTAAGNILEELEVVNQSLRNRDKLKDNSIAQLSDQLVALLTRLQEIERQQLL